MLQTFDALLAQPLLLLIVLTIGAAIGIGVEKGFAAVERSRRKAYWAGRKHAGKAGAAAKPVVAATGTARSGPALAADQLRRVMQSDFAARALLNKPERRLLTCIDRVLSEESPGWRAMAQVSLGEFLASRDKEAFFAVNSKRVDLLIVDPDCRPLHAIEFQGSGHHIGEDTAATR